MPPLMERPDFLSLRQALAVREVVAAAEEELIVWYGEGPGNLRVPTQGNELVTETEGGLATNVKVPLQYIPMAWAPYFMAAQLPEVARRTLRRLTEGHMTEQQRGPTIRLETWMRAGCMRSGSIGANRYSSKLHMMTWVAHQAVLDWSMARWATRRLAPFLPVPVVVAPPPAAPVIIPPAGAGGAIMPPLMGGGGGGFWRHPV